MEMNAIVVKMKLFFSFITVQISYINSCIHIKTKIKYEMIKMMLFNHCGEALTLQGPIPNPAGKSLTFNFPNLA